MLWLGFASSGLPQTISEHTIAVRRRGGDEVVDELGLLFLADGEYRQLFIDDSGL